MVDGVLLRVQMVQQIQQHGLHIMLESIWDFFLQTNGFPPKRNKRLDTSVSNVEVGEQIRCWSDRGFRFAISTPFSHAPEKKAYNSHFSESTLFSDEREKKAYMPHFSESTLFSDEREKKAYIPHFSESTLFSDEREKKAYNSHFSESTLFSDEREKKAYIP
jgi:hypothetical protein